MGKSITIKYYAIVSESETEQSLIYENRLQDIVARMAQLRHNLHVGDKIKVWGQINPKYDGIITIKKDIILKEKYLIGEPCFENLDIEFRNMYIVPRKYYSMKTFDSSICA